MEPTYFIKPEKLTLNQKKLKYDKIYNEMSDLLKKYNVCDIHIEKGITQCIGKILMSYEDTTGKLCCHNCRHLTKHGCRVKALSCKLWICYSAIENLCNILPKEDLIYFFGMKKYLHQQLRIYHIPAGARDSKRENFKI